MKDINKCVMFGSVIEIAERPGKQVVVSTEETSMTIGTMPITKKKGGQSCITGISGTVSLTKIERVDQWSLGLNEIVAGLNAGAYNDSRVENGDSMFEVLLRESQKPPICF